MRRWRRSHNRRSHLILKGRWGPYANTPHSVLTSPSFPLLAGSPNVDMSAIPVSLDQVVSPTVVDQIIQLFFDYVYPLTPCLHRPTFLADLAARRDKTDPIFFSLVLVVLASTLVQVPRVLVNLDKQEVEALARRCVRVARTKVAFIWEDPVPVRAEFGEPTYLVGPLLTCYSCHLLPRGHCSPTLGQQHCACDCHITGQPVRTRHAPQ